MRRSIVLGVAALALAASAGPLSAAEAVAAKTACGAETVAAETAAAAACEDLYPSLSFPAGRNAALEGDPADRDHHRGLRHQANSLHDGPVGEGLADPERAGGRNGHLRELWSKASTCTTSSAARRSPLQQPDRQKASARLRGHGPAGGHVLALVTMDSRGRDPIPPAETQVKAAAEENEGPMTVPLPASRWPWARPGRCPSELAVPLAGGIVKKIKTMQKFKLASVDATAWPRSN